MPILSGDRKASKRAQVQSLEALPPDSIEEAFERALDEGGITEAHSVDIRLQENERAVYTLTRLFCLKEHVRNDVEICHILVGKRDGLSAKEIQRRGGMTETTYQSACKRLHRRMEALLLKPGEIGYWNPELPTRFQDSLTLEDVRRHNEFDCGTGMPVLYRNGAAAMLGTDDHGEPLEYYDIENWMVRLVYQPWANCTSTSVLTELAMKHCSCAHDVDVLPLPPSAAVCRYKRSVD